jgi:hypothetical protein
MGGPAGIMRLPGTRARFRSSCYIAAYSYTNFASKGALATLMSLVPLFDLKFLNELAASSVGT